MKLLCTVRGCQEALVCDEKRCVCRNSHSFDIARSGYINLLQPQDRRSRNPGDSKEAVAARRRFLERGFAQPLIDAVAALVTDGPVLDVGCGEGRQLAAFGCDESHGVDISVPAIDLAARTWRDCQFIVANADRFLPYENGSFAFVTSVTARLNASEFHRVLRPGGTVIVAVAAPDDLIELREAILGERKLIDRTESAITTLEPHFHLVKQENVRSVAHLDLQAIEDVMTSSYRGMRTREREALARLSEMDVTLSRDVLVFEPSPSREDAGEKVARSAG
jgi:23S rRNA (guanine745-N1)-methyltransferase